MNISLLGKSVLIVHVLALTSCAELFLQPALLEPGDRYRLIFATSQTRDATSADIEVYNDFVQGVADDSPIVGSWGLEWKALISTAEVDARDNIEHAPNDEIVPVFAVDGTPVARDGGLFFGLQPEFDVSFSGQTELGTMLPRRPHRFIDFQEIMPVFTGSDTSGRAHTNGLVDAHAGSELGTTMVSTGYGGPDFLEHMSYPSEARLHFYAVSEVITSVPEPSSQVLSVLGFSLALLLWRRNLTLQNRLVG